MVYFRKVFCTMSNYINVTYLPRLIGIEFSVNPRSVPPCVEFRVDTFSDCALLVNSSPQTQVRPVVLLWGTEIFVFFLWSTWLKRDQRTQVVPLGSGRNNIPRKTYRRDFHGLLSYRTGQTTTKSLIYPFNCHSLPRLLFLSPLHLVVLDSDYVYSPGRYGGSGPLSLTPWTCIKCSDLVPVVLPGSRLIVSIRFRLNYKVLPRLILVLHLHFYVVIIKIPLDLCPYIRLVILRPLSTNRTTFTTKIHKITEYLLNSLTYLYRLLPSQTFKGGWKSFYEVHELGSDPILKKNWNILVRTFSIGN